MRTPQTSKILRSHIAYSNEHPLSIRLKTCKNIDSIAINIEILKVVIIDFGIEWEQMFL